MTISQSKNQRIVLLYPDENGYIIAEVPSLPGCISQGETREEALENIQEAISLHLEVLQERGEVIPEDEIEIASVIV
jgi:predicted RNase H-like HicB family nuclease